MKYKYFIYLGIISSLLLTGCGEQSKKKKISKIAREMRTKIDDISKKQE